MTSKRLGLSALPLPTGLISGVALGLLAIVATGCGSGGGSSSTPGDSVGGDFVVLRTEPATNSELFLNDSISIDFSTPVDISSVDANSVNFVVRNVAGDLLQETPIGTFELARRPGDVDVGRRLRFNPRLPTNDTFTDGGFRPGRVYQIQLIGGNPNDDNVLRSTTGRGLESAVTFTLRTPDGNSADDLFRDVVIGGPRVTAVDVSPLMPVAAPGGGIENRVPLNRFSSQPVEIRLTFNQPLNPSSANIPDINPDPLLRGDEQGRIFLQTASTEDPVPATIDLEVNTTTTAQVVIRPIGLLPSNTEIEVVVLLDLQDLAGQSNDDPAIEPVVSSFRTIDAAEPQFDALIENFISAELLDTTAPFLEPQAEVVNGRLRSTFDFNGSETPLIYQPGQDVVLNTESTLITPLGAPPRTVTGGVFRFRQLIVPAGVSVQGVGANPMVWIITDSVTINGSLSVSGSNGQTATGAGVADQVLLGGFGGAGAGRGGNGSPSATTRSPNGQGGFGPGAIAGMGGTGGSLSFQSGCERGSGGGGGSFATEGDPNYLSPTPLGIIFGNGDGGCTTTGAVLIGGASGDDAFTDSRGDNDFWGSGVNINDRVRIQGELAAVRGGTGGGGGGDQDPSGSGSVDDPAFTNDRRGGAAGGGGGALVIQCLGTIRIGESGRITANGGDGQAGDVGPAGTGGFPTGGGGGGAGSGGMVVLMSAQGIEIVEHGGLYQDTETVPAPPNDFNFAISADGGVSRQGPVTNAPVTSKYFSPGGLADFSWTDRSSPGGFGGMGIVQLMAPPGDNSDGTNTVLDDNIRFFTTGGDEIMGAAKQARISWRGWPLSLGSTIGEDDDGDMVNLGDAAGDIRPNPILLPVPFGGLSRARSRWVDLGSVDRTPVVSLTGENQVVVGPGEVAPGPDFEFPGIGASQLFGDTTGDGYLRFSTGGGQAQPAPPVVASTPILPGSFVDGGQAFGQPVFVVEAATPLVDVTENEFSSFRLRALDGSGASLGEFRILSHDDAEFVLAQDAALPSGVVSFDVVARLVSVLTSGAPGLGSSYVPQPGIVAPLQNVRIGFAFSTDPGDPAGLRWPAQEGQFEHNLDLTTNIPFATWLRTNRPTSVRYDVLFNKRFTPDPSVGNINTNLQLNVATPRQEIDFLALPYRF